MRVSITILLALLCACRASTDHSSPPSARYVGREPCAGCHPAEAKAYRGSHHDLAMQPADSTTVLGDFSGATYTYGRVTSSFFRRDGGYWVRTDGADGALHDYRVSYTFGLYPLQQYLIPLPRGRLQALGIVWDARPRDQGGQRWYHLYPGQHVTSIDFLHWTGPLQNWNYMCAECHSTAVRRGYDQARDSFATTWSEIDVSCEACHGPGSAHLAWARDSARRYRADSTAGLVVRLRPHSSGTWKFEGDRPIARRVRPLESSAEVETCGWCHARRATIWSDHRPGEPLEQSVRVSLLQEDLYFPDGQQREEVYEYGSFIQSKMARAGVTCSDCHDPHSGKLRGTGNALCTSCHLASHYDTSTHHFHPMTTAGALCVSCHMPSRNYMVVDARRDHSFRVPRPDLSIRLGTPNPCTGCHQALGNEWAAAALGRWYGSRDTVAAHYGTAIEAGRRQSPEAAELLQQLARDTTAPAIARATAVSLLPRNAGPQTLGAIQIALEDREPWVRRAAAEALTSVEPGLRLRMGLPLLQDSIRSVRLAATSALADVAAGDWSEAERRTFAAAAREYRAAQLVNDDRAEAHANLGQFALAQGDGPEAESQFRTALARWSGFLPGWVLLAEAVRRSRGEPAADSILRAGLKVNPEAAELHHALGLSLVRQGRREEALVALALATRLDSGDARYAYVYAVALHDLGHRARALEVLDEASRRSPDDRDLLHALLSYALEGGRSDIAHRAASRLLELAPGDPDARRAIGALQGRGH
jgi:tetratricopeptide (TPR) repeat protein